MLVVLSAVVFLLTIGIGISFQKASEASRESLVSEIMARDDLRAKQLAETIAEQTSALIRLLDSSLVQVGETYFHDPKAFDVALQSVLKALPSEAVMLIRITDSNGTVVFSSNGQGQGTSLADRAYYQVHRQSDTGVAFVGDPVESQVLHRWVIPVSRGFYADGVLQGVVTVALSPEYLARSFSFLTLNAGDFIALIKRDGTFLARNHNLEIAMGRKAPTDRPFLDPNRSDVETFRAISSIDNIMADFAWKRLYPWPLIAVVALDEDTELAPIHAATQENVSRTQLITALVIMIGGGVALLLLWAARQQRMLALGDQRYRAVMATAGDGIHIVHQDGELFEANDAFYRMLGYDPSRPPALRVKDWDAALTPDQQQDTLERMRNASAAFVFETAHRRADGTIFDAEVSAHPITFDGRPLLYCASRDISDRKRAERALIESEQRFRLMTSSVQDYAIFMLDTQGVVRTWNDGAFRLKGYREEEVIGRSVDVFYTPEDQNEGKAEVLMALAAEKDVVEDEGWRVRKDGSRFWADVVISALRGEDGELLGFAKITHDITERKLIENRLGESLAKQRRILESIPVGIAIVDTGRVIREVNQAFCEIFLRSSTDMVGQSTRILYESDAVFAEMGAKTYPHLQEAGDTFRGDVPMTRGDGKAIWIRVSSRLVDTRPGRLEVIWAFEDISERKAMELELSRSNTELEQFAYVASHDLRQPLRTIGSYLSLIEKELGGTLTDDTRQFLNFAVGGAKRMDSLILGLLDYSRIGKTGTVEDVPLAEVVAEAVSNLRTAIDEAGADLTLPLDFPVLRGNRTDLMRLFQNLLGNAVKYHAADRVPKIVVSVGDEGSQWVICVADNGIGIPADALERVFGIFQRLVSREQYEGTGIGLAVCKKIVERHGGRIWVDSDLGQGSRFQIAFPKE